MFNKLKEKFLDTLEYDKFMVKAIKKEAFTSTFRVKKMSNALT
jgi:F420-dependent methylenetetrahydromethanopterin dehydrogenase